MSISGYSLPMLAISILLFAELSSFCFDASLLE
jgi:hypothetical protein